MNTDLITSRANPLIKELRALEQSKARARRGEFWVEGIQLVIRALDSGAGVRMVVTAPGLKSAAGREAVRRAERAGIRVVRVSDEVMETLAAREHPTGLGAVVTLPPTRLADLAVAANSLFVALYEVTNPGNLGSILRTCDAVGVAGVILVGAVTDPFAPAAVTASRGTLFTVPLARVQDAGALLKWSRENGLNWLAATDKSPKTLWETEFKRPVLLVLGNEGEGLPEALLDEGETVRIPMGGKVDSLNLSVAAGVILYEYVRQLTYHESGGL